MWAISATAASNGSRILSLTVVTPVTLRTYCRAAASISSFVAEGPRWAKTGPAAKRDVGPGHVSAGWSPPDGRGDRI